MPTFQTIKTIGIIHIFRNALTSDFIVMVVNSICFLAAEEPIRNGIIRTVTLATNTACHINMEIKIDCISETGKFFFRFFVWCKVIYQFKAIMSNGIELTSKHTHCANMFSVNIPLLNSMLILLLRGLPVTASSTDRLSICNEQSALDENPFTLLSTVITRSGNAVHATLLILFK